MEETIIRQPKQEPIDIPLKKAKFIDEKYLLDYQYQAMILAQYRQAPHSFRPWTQLVPPPIVPLVAAGTTKHLPHLPYAASLPYLSQEPPILQNPERVVRLSECERFEQTYQPNVALKPRNKNVNSSSSTTSSSTPMTAASNAIKERERDSSRNRDYDCCDGDRNIERLQTDSIDIKIKQERPNTPIEDGTSQSPESRMESPPSSAVVANPTAPISPEGQSGSSNEITSSTSPVPATTSHKQQQNETTSTIHSPKTPPPPIDNHHIHHMLRSHHHHSTKPTTDTHHQPLQNSHHNSHHIRHSTSLTNGTYNHHLKFNGASHLNNSEFELSTDTDDDSLAGEADSSNNTAPLDIAIEALKDTRPQDRDKVLHIIKMLLHENIQMTLKHNKLLQELRRKDDEITDLLQLNRVNHKSPIIKSEEMVSVTTPAATVDSKKPVITVSPIAKTTIIEVGGSINTSTESPLPATTKANTTVTTVSTATSVVEPKKKSETEVIRMPLKKSARRSPEETVVIIQPHKKREDVREKTLDKVARFYERDNQSSPSPIHHTSDTSIVSAASSAVATESETKVASNA